ncbi:hypothetical protein [Streptomyces sp. HD]|uniref:hypothetical protein n=1 Tax=Streptomyces sp. HD TaxID=3020892 RepID=UPI00233077FB|nr:hypothetical protein [Streptomyces sp. HD]MDC0772629.1 hypothetical protein [Streptomyces sp. HD]
MHSGKRTAVLASTVAALVGIGVANSTYASAAPSCESKICEWEQIDYKGHKKTAGLVDGVCYHGNEVASVVITADTKVRFYSGKRCTGLTKVKGKGSISNMTEYAGFLAYSYKKV